MKKILVSLAVLFLAACSNTPSQAPQSLSFKQYQPINLNVSRVEVAEDYKSPLAAPNIEHLMPYSPADAVHIWVKDRVRSVGGDNFAIITIKDASVKASDLPTTQGFKGLFTIDQDKKYDARLEVEIRIYDGGVLSKADANATVTRSITLAENASVETRKAAYMQMIRDLMTSFNAEMEKNMFSYMGSYIKFTR